MKLRRGIATVADLRARCRVDPATHCWHWLGARSQSKNGAPGLPAIHTFDHARGEKRTMSGPAAAWNIAHQAAPIFPIVFRACGCDVCLNPAHLREARNYAEVGLHLRRSGSRKGTHLEQRLTSLRKAVAARGIEPTPEHIVLAVRAAPADITTSALAAQHGIAVQTASRIRRGESHRHLLPAPTEACS